MSRPAIAGAALVGVASLNTWSLLAHPIWAGPAVTAAIGILTAFAAFHLGKYAAKGAPPAGKLWSAPR